MLLCALFALGAFAVLSSRAAPRNPHVDPPAQALSAARVSLVGPSDEAHSVSTYPTMQVALAAGAEPATIRFYARQVTGSPGPDFTLIGIPDTQYYTSSLGGGTPTIFHQQTAWIAQQRAARNIAFATHLGDCVEHGDSDLRQWLHADAAMRRLERATSPHQPDGIPYGIAVGNHDQSPFGVAQGQTTVFYNKIFGSYRYARRAYFGGHYGTNNDNHYELFSASGLHFIVIHLEFDPGADRRVLAWADSLLKRHANRRGILVSHHFINEGNPGTFGPQGWLTYVALRANPNLFLFLNGHVPGEGRRTERFEGREIHMLVSNYQLRPRGGDGWLRILEFSPQSSVIRVRTYSPTRGEFEADADSSSQFTIPCDLSGPDFAEMGEVTGVTGGTVGVPFVDLESDADYEWYVTVTDAAGTSTGPLWRFRTNRAHLLETAATAAGTIARTPLRRRYDDGSQVTLRAVAPEGKRFAGWTGDATGYDNPITLTMDRPMNVMAVFEDVELGLDVAVAPLVLTMGNPTPSPTSGSATIRFGLPRAARVLLRVLDVQGRAVSTLAAGDLPAGMHHAVWDGRVDAAAAAPSGTYFIVLESGGERRVRRITLAR